MTLAALLSYIIHYIIRNIFGVEMFSSVMVAGRGEGKSDMGHFSIGFMEK
jgi:hypothetical protein